MNAWIFDVDGVITNLETKQPNKLILDVILKLLERKEVVALVSGRAFDWLNERVINHIKNRITDKNLLNNFFVTAEFGGITCFYSKEEEHKIIDDHLAVPPDILTKAKQIAQDFKDSMFVDNQKQTHFTVEMKDNFDINIFKERQKQLSQELHQLIVENKNFEVHDDRIATNLKNVNSNKHTAVKKMLEWLISTNLIIENFYAFGDSESDLEIGEELSAQGKQIKFIYVGGNLDANDYGFQIIKTAKLYEEGTLEYLTSHN